MWIFKHSASVQYHIAKVCNMINSLAVDSNQSAAVYLAGSVQVNAQISARATTSSEGVEIFSGYSFRDDLGTIKIAAETLKSADGTFLFSAQRCHSKP